MREIKFRAWHTKQNRMYSANEMGTDELTLAVDGRGFVNVSSISPIHSTYAGNSMIPMQFTGLTDKNGKEIYEGDILIDDTKHKVFKVKWVDGGFNIINNNFFRVIGNIYENPTLLEDKK